MDNIFDIYQFILSICDKDGQSQPTAEFVGEALAIGQQGKFNEFRKEIELNNFTPSALAPFLTQFPFVSTISGFAKPSDCCHVERVMSGETEYTPILQNEVTAAYKSALHPITSWPRYYEIGGNIILLPAINVSGQLIYLKNPVTPVIGYIPNAANEPVYAPASSVELGFNKSYWGDIISTALAYIGISLSSQEVTSLAGIKTTNPES